MARPAPKAQPQHGTSQRSSPINFDHPQASSTRGMTIRKVLAAFACSALLGTQAIAQVPCPPNSGQGGAERNCDSLCPGVGVRPALCDYRQAIGRVCDDCEFWYCLDSPTDDPCDLDFEEWFCGKLVGYCYPLGFCDASSIDPMLKLHAALIYADECGDCGPAQAIFLSLVDHPDAEIRDALCAMRGNDCFVDIRDSVLCYDRTSPGFISPMVNPDGSWKFGGGPPSINPINFPDPTHMPPPSGVDPRTGADDHDVVDLMLPSEGTGWRVARSFAMFAIERDESLGTSGILEAHGPQGHNWFHDGMMRLTRSIGTGPNGEDEIQLQATATSGLAFRRVDSGFTYEQYGAGEGLVIDNNPASGADSTFTYHDAFGNRTTFFGFHTSIPTALQGRPWKFIDTAGTVVYIGDESDASDAQSAGYHSDGRIKVVYDAWTAESGYIDRRRYMYNYTTVGTQSQIADIDVDIATGGTWATTPTGIETIAEVVYDYFDSDVQDRGQVGDLRSVNVRVLMNPADAAGLSDVDAVVSERKRLYRYFTRDWSDSDGRRGHPRFIRLTLDPEGYRRADIDADGVLDDELASGEPMAATTPVDYTDDDNLFPYAAKYYEYERFAFADNWPVSDWRDFEYGRITKAKYRQGCSPCGSSTSMMTYRYEPHPYLGRADSQGRALPNWQQRTIMGLPDGSFRTLVYGLQGLPIFSIVSDGDPKLHDEEPGLNSNVWITEFVRDGRGRMTHMVTPETFTDYNHVEADGVIATASTTAGLVHVYDRFSTMDHKDGKIQHIGVRQGRDLGGSYTKLSTADYDDPRTLTPKNGAGVDASRSIELTFADTSIRLRNDDGTGGIETGSAASFHGTATNDPDRLITEEFVLTLPDVPTNQNGDADSVGTSGKRYHRPDGTAAFSLAPDGIISYASHRNRQLISQVVDADTSETFPSGDDPVSDFGLPASTAGAKHLAVDIDRDVFGRVDTMQGPSGREVGQFRTVLDDGRLVMLSFPKVDGATYHGPVGYRVVNHTGRSEFSAVIGLSGGTTTTHPRDWFNLSLAPDSTRKRVDPTAALTLSGASLTSVSSREFDKSGTRVEEVRRHIDLASFPGTDGTHYDATELVYDDMGRVEKMVDPTDTISRYTFDGIGRRSEAWVGTDDTSWPTVSGGNMVRISLTTYDDGLAGKNGRVTRQRMFEDAAGTSTRDTKLLYDERGRLKVVDGPDGPDLLFDYDNMDRVVHTAAYAGDSATALTATTATTRTLDRLSLGTVHFDELGRAWKSESFKIIQSGGSRGQIATESGSDIRLVSQSWFDEVGRLAKAMGQNIAKVDYDRLGNPVRTFVIAKDDDASYADVLDVSGDHVVKETQTVFDYDRGLVIATATIDRYHSDLGGSTDTRGPLDTGWAASDLIWDQGVGGDIEGRLSVAASWFDELDRMATVVQYGTNDEADLDLTALRTPSSTPPSRVAGGPRVIDVAYDKFGRQFSATDPKGIESRVLFDDAGRSIATIENYVDGTASGGAGGGTLNDHDRITRYAYEKGLLKTITADMPTSTGEPDQVTTYTYGVTDSGAGASEIVHNAMLRSITFPDSAGGTDVVAFGYNALGQRTWMRDQNQTVLETSYDTLGRPTAHAVTLATSPPAHLDDWVLRLELGYDERGGVASVTQFDAATGGSVVNDIAFVYDDWGTLKTFSQDHDSAVGGSSSGRYDIDYTTETALSLGSGAYRALRIADATLPSGTVVGHRFSSAADSLDDLLNRVSAVTMNPDGLLGTPPDVAEYQYLGMAGVVHTRLGAGLYDTVNNNLIDEGVYSSLYDPTVTGSIPSYDRLDRFGQITRKAWNWEMPGASADQAMFDISMSYDDNGWLTAVRDNRDDVILGFVYEHDDLGRLVKATRGDVTLGSPPTVASPNHFEEFEVGHTGNRAFHGLDTDGDNTTGTGDFEFLASNSLSADFSKANEQDKHSVELNASVFTSADRVTTFAHDDIGLMHSESRDVDGVLGTDHELEYTYDVFGRLREIAHEGPSARSAVAIAKYGYNGLGHRTTWQRDWSQSASPGVPDGVIDANDPVLHLVHNERWQQVATYIAGDSHPKEEFVHHAAGFSGVGTSSALDSIILRDDHGDVEWHASPTKHPDRRTYYLQNHRLDVVAVLDAKGGVLERAWYEPYGMPFGHSEYDDDRASGNEVPDGVGTGADNFEWNDRYSGGDLRADYATATEPSRPDGVLTGADFFRHLDLATWADSLGRGKLSGDEAAEDLRNRRGYAGYETERFDLGGGEQLVINHVRNRVYRPGLGRWMQRDPAGYVDGMSMYEYAMSSPANYIDPMGLWCRFGGRLFATPDSSEDNFPLKGLVEYPPSVLGMWPSPDPAQLARDIGVPVWTDVTRPSVDFQKQSQAIAEMAASIEQDISRYNEAYGDSQWAQYFDTQLDEASKTMMQMQATLGAIDGAADITIAITIATLATDGLEAAKLGKLISRLRPILPLSSLYSGVAALRKYAETGDESALGEGALQLSVAGLSGAALFLPAKEGGKLASRLMLGLNIAAGVAGSIGGFVAVKTAVQEEKNRIMERQKYLDNKYASQWAIMQRLKDLNEMASSLFKSMQIIYKWSTIPECEFSPHMEIDLTIRSIADPLHRDGGGGPPANLPYGGTDIAGY